MGGLQESSCGAASGNSLQGGCVVGCRTTKCKQSRGPEHDLLISPRLFEIGVSNRQSSSFTCGACEASQPSIYGLGGVPRSGSGFRIDDKGPGPDLVLPYSSEVVSHSQYLASSAPKSR